MLYSGLSSVCSLHVWTRVARNVSNKTNEQKANERRILSSSLIHEHPPHCISIPAQFAMSFLHGRISIFIGETEWRAATWYYNGHMLCYPHPHSHRSRTHKIQPGSVFLTDMQLWGDSKNQLWGDPQNQLRTPTLADSKNYLFGESFTLSSLFRFREVGFWTCPRSWFWESPTSWFWEYSLESIYIYIMHCGGCFLPSSWQAWLQSWRHAKRSER